MIDREQIERAARVIRDGGLVAFPTETVYGLGVNALDTSAVARLFTVKRRPRESPLIVHTCSTDMARTLVRYWPRGAEQLAQRYWPGPLTLIAPRHPNIPLLVTSGLDTVALRVPSHPVAQALLREAGLPIAAPSANKFTELSSTTAAHVRKAFGDELDMILDGGPATVGIESTVVSLTGEQPVILRPGMISATEIANLVGPLGLAERASVAHASPGMHARHYRPKTNLLLVRKGALPAHGTGAYLTSHEEDSRQAGAARMIRMPAEPAAYAARLYDTLHRLDEDRYDWIAVEQPSDSPEWAGVLDRLRRAAALEDVP